MERINNNKNALSLFIASIVLGVIAVIDLIFTFSSMDVIMDNIRKVLIDQGMETEQALIIMSGFRAGYIFGLLLSAVLYLFVVLSGLKSSMQGKWRTATIVFGILLVIEVFLTIAIISAGLIAIIEAGVVVWYLVSAILCKPDEVKELKTIEVVEEKDENL